MNARTRGESSGTGKRILISLLVTVLLLGGLAAGGTTGTSPGCHLHFEVRINGVATNPVSFMSGQGIQLG